jgi:hypothetical protein
MYVRPTLPPEAALPPGTHPAEPLPTGEYHQHVWAPSLLLAGSEAECYPDTSLIQYQIHKTSNNFCYSISTMALPEFFYPSLPTARCIIFSIISLLCPLVPTVAFSHALISTSILMVFVDRTLLPYSIILPLGSQVYLSLEHVLRSVARSKQVCICIGWKQLSYSYRIYG